MGIGSITPRIDYAQGNEFFNEFKTLDDIHKPALDGIGYQDSLNWQRAWWDNTYMTNLARHKRVKAKRSCGLFLIDLIVSNSFFVIGIKSISIKEYFFAFLTCLSMVSCHFTGLKLG